MSIILSLLIILVIAGYTVAKLASLPINNEAVDFTVTELVDYYDDTEAFTYDDGLNVAFGLAINRGLDWNSTHFKF